jgi:hypothetical protein
MIKNPDNLMVVANPKTNAESAKYLFCIESMANVNGYKPMSKKARNNVSLEL